MMSLRTTLILTVGLLSLASSCRREPKKPVVVQKQSDKMTEEQCAKEDSSKFVWNQVTQNCDPIANQPTKPTVPELTEKEKPKPEEKKPDPEVECDPIGPDSDCDAPLEPQETQLASKELLKELLGDKFGQCTYDGHAGLAACIKFKGGDACYENNNCGNAPPAGYEKRK